jgi:hypothetical protein
VTAVLLLGAAYVALVVEYGWGGLLVAVVHVLLMAAACRG